MICIAAYLKYGAPHIPIYKEGYYAKSKKAPVWKMESKGILAY